MTAESWSEKIQALLDEHDLGLLTSVMGLLLGLVTINPAGYEPCVKKVIWILTKVRHLICTHDTNRLTIDIN
jgi:hypothetical protein